MSPSLGMRGVVAVVGGTRGIGAAIVAKLLVAGAVPIALGPSGEEDELPPGAIVLRGDARAPHAIEALLDRAMDHSEPLLGLIHVAGGSGRRFGDGPLDCLTDQGWEETLRWNLDSVFLSNRAVVRRLLTRGAGGSVVNIGSVLARHAAPRYFATHAYATAKAAIEGLTFACAAHYAAADIRFNVIAPGLIDTPMAQRAVHDPEIAPFLEAKQPLRGGGPGRPEDVAAAAVWLLSPEARWMTGQCLAVDGGWSVTDAAATSLPPSVTPSVRNEP